MSCVSFFRGVQGPGSIQNFWFQAHPVEAGPRPAPVYWANDLFLRRAISLAADMAESGRTPAPRTDRHGHSRAPLSAARRTFSTPGQARLANLFDQAAPAPARAALHLAHSSQRPRSDPHHAAARHHRRRQGFRAASRRLDRRASRPVAEGGAVSSGHRGAAARRRAPDRASRRRARHGVDRNARQRRADHLRRRRRRAYRAPGARFPEARGAQRSAEGLAGLRRGAMASR